MKVELMDAPGILMECPRCGKEGFAEEGLNICSRCLAEFRVEQ